MSDVGVINYGMGNIDSVCRAIEKIGYDVEVINDPSRLQAVAKIILPGVGAYPAAMQHLKDSGFIDALHEAVNQQDKPLLGICLGMQLLSDYGDESGGAQGLGYIPGKVIRLESSHAKERVPHVGWNEVDFVNDHCLFQALKPASDFYFVHSYHFVCDDNADVLATSPYCGETTVAIRKGNVFGVQFHPEKSQRCGLKLLQNFMEL